MIGALAQIKPTNMRASAPWSWLRGDIPPWEAGRFCFFFQNELVQFDEYTFSEIFIEMNIDITI